MITLKPETPTDQAELFQVVRQAFNQAKEAQLVDLLRARGNARLATVAKDQQCIVGYVVASPLSLIPTAKLTCLAIGPVAVLPQRQGEGIGSRLMQHVIRTATTQNVDALFLLGSPGYYQRFGFAPTHIANEYGASDAFMALELQPQALRDVSALARYVGEFAEVGA